MEDLFVIGLCFGAFVLGNATGFVFGLASAPRRSRLNFDLLPDGVTRLPRGTYAERNEQA